MAWTAEVLELPRGTHRHLSPHFAKKKDRNKLHRGGIGVTVLRSCFREVLRESKSRPALCGGIGCLCQAGICARLHTKDWASIILRPAKAGSCACAEELRGHIAGEHATREVAGSISVSEGVQMHCFSTGRRKNFEAIQIFYCAPNGPC
ncbi:hypothetical protein AOQ84DRAFT_32029 [Glonium stellatum]|uniref:Uncharacterized protein n=1 Tax=Glonium stellatum TaxID=574774 RepID=A0A8E2F1K0_9PEZI|nr:hypothetical protein AOQ84DRAFT_32029 [Glonium stellatum]